MSIHTRSIIPNESVASLFRQNGSDINVSNPKYQRTSNSPETDALSYAEEVELTKSGYKNIGIYSLTASTNPEQEENKAKEEKALRTMVTRSIQMDAFLSNTQSVVSSLSSLVSTEKAWLNVHEKAFVQVTPQQLLYAKDGEIISFKDIPPGEDPRDYLVQTLDEKRHLEDLTQSCLLGKAEQEVGFVDGQMVDIRAHHEAKPMRKDLAALEETERKLKAGDISPHDLPQDLQDRLLERANRNDAAITPENAASLLPPAATPAAPAPAP